MLYFTKIKIFIIYTIIIFLSIFSFANFVDNKENFILSKKINLGLDLQGGSYLLLEVNSDPIVDRYLQEKLLNIRVGLHPFSWNYACFDRRVCPQRFGSESSKLDIAW